MIPQVKVSWQPHFGVSQRCAIAWLIRWDLVVSQKVKLSNFYPKEHSLVSVMIWWFYRISLGTDVSEGDCDWMYWKLLKGQESLTGQQGRTSHIQLSPKVINESIVMGKPQCQGCLHASMFKYHCYYTSEFDLTATDQSFPRGHPTRKCWAAAPQPLQMEIQSKCINPLTAA